MERIEEHTRQGVMQIRKDDRFEKRELERANAFAASGARRGDTVQIFYTKRGVDARPLVGTLGYSLHQVQGREMPVRLWVREGTETVKIKNFKDIKVIQKAII
ncbi:MAG: hypothetical protein AAB573_03585 [Patescibacteria group bacterium]